MRNTFLFNVCLLFLVVSCKQADKKEPLKSQKFEKSKVIFKIDEGTEFFRTIFNLAIQDQSPDDLKPCQTEYLEKVNEHFLPFKDHPLIRWIYDDENIGIDFSAIGLMYKDIETFEFDPAYSKELKTFGINKHTLDSVRPLMIDFYQKSQFGTFFKNNQTYYQQALSKIQQQVNDEELFDKVMAFYQSEEKGLEFVVFVELTNNANSKAILFYDRFNPKKRAMILANHCESYDQPDASNEILTLDSSKKGVLFHESSHLFTDRLLTENLGDLKQYEFICEDCSPEKMTDRIDHLIVYPLQGLLMKRFDNNDEGHEFFLNTCTDVRKEIYQKLMAYHPENEIPFEITYRECLDLIKHNKSKI